MTVLASNDGEFPPEGRLLIGRSGGGRVLLAYRRYMSVLGGLAFELAPGEACPNDAAYASPSPRPPSLAPGGGRVLRFGGGGGEIKVAGIGGGGFKQQGGWMLAGFKGGAEADVMYATARTDRGGDAVLTAEGGTLFPQGMVTVHPEKARTPFPVEKTRVGGGGSEGHDTQETSPGHGSQSLVLAAHSGGGFSRGGGEVWLSSGRRGGGLLAFPYASAEYRVGGRTVELHAPKGGGVVYPEWAQFAGPAGRGAW